MAIVFKYTPPKLDGLVLMAEAAELAVDAVAHDILDASQPAVPVEDGIMKASGRVVPGEITLGLASAHITYGSDDDDTATHAPSNQYVVKQHEDGELYHPGGGNWKWLEHAMHGVALTAPETMARVVRKVLGL